MLPFERIFHFLLFLFLSSGYFADVLVKNFDNYGPFKIEFTRFDACVGPKLRNITDYTLNLTKEGEDFFLRANFTYFKRCHIDELKIKSYSIKDNKKTLLISYNINDPCHHYSVANILEKYFNTSKCWVDKGDYFIDLNISNTSRIFYGKNFFYGEFLIKSIVTSKQGNILCCTINSIITKDN